MYLTDVRKMTLMAYCRIDDRDAEEAFLLESLYAAAVAYMEQAGVSEPTEGSLRRAQYDLAINYLVLDAYDQRETTFSGTVVADNPAFRRILNQLKLTEPVVSDSDTTGTGT
nr:MAG TPA: head tail connector [Caudoviricetes sp.]